MTKAKWVKIYVCKADKRIFVKEYKDVPKEFQDKIGSMGGLPCEGSGYPGPWCRRCTWGAIDEEYDELLED